MLRWGLVAGLVASVISGCSQNNGRFESLSLGGRCGHRCEKVAYNKCHTCKTNCNRVALHDCDDDDDDHYVTVSDPYYRTDSSLPSSKFTYADSRPIPQYGTIATQTTTNYSLTAGQPGGQDATFVREAAFANLAEIEMGRLGVANATNAEVRNFAQSMIDDHGKSQSELETVAMRMNFDMPAQLDARHREMSSQLARTGGMDFDIQFMDAMIRDHREVVNKFERRASNPPANDVQRFAIDSLPKLRHHLQMAQDIRSRLRG